ncbi:MAG TPA: hypothetical protein VE399_08340 [Gemmatimonadales bacterium]|jgi:hypothetical protein|nr:hypothetical protein [Gemmatimonadales bacterium]
MTLRWTRVRGIALTLTAAAIVACGGDLSTANSVLPNGAVEDIGSTARDEVESALSALTLPSSLDPLGTAPATTAYYASCVNPTTPDDSDGDGVPNDAVYLFTAPPCRFTGWRGGTLEFTGQLRIQDPAPLAAGFGYEGTLTDLLTRFTSADGRVIYDVRRNGTRVLSGSVSSLILSTDLRLHRTFIGKLDAEVDQQWTLTYTPSASLQINAPVPSGTLDIAGTLDWTRATEHYVLTVTTPTPLHYNADCADTVQRIDAGEMHLAGSFNGTDGTVLVRWSECGREPSFSFDPA